MSRAVSVTVAPVTSPGMCCVVVIEYNCGSASVTVPELVPKSSVTSVAGVPVSPAAGDGLTASVE